MNNHIGFYLKFHKEKDKDMINKLQSVQNKQGYIKGLINKDLYINSRKGANNG